MQLLNVISVNNHKIIDFGAHLQSGDEAPRLLILPLDLKAGTNGVDNATRIVHTEIVLVVIVEAL